MSEWILSIDLSTPEGIVTLEGYGKLFHREVAAASRVSELFVEAGELLSLAAIKSTDIGAIGVARGPGSFTGIRVAVMAAKTLAATLGVPLAAPDSPEVIAEGCRGLAEAVMVASDARRGEVYYGLYRLDEPAPRVLERPQVAKPEAAVACLLQWQNRLGEKIGLAGSALAAYPAAWPHDVLLIEETGPGPMGLSGLCRRYHELGRVEEPLELMPLYLRRPDARESVSLPGGVPCT